jgi:hypothetical protein
MIDLSWSNTVAVGSMEKVVRLKRGLALMTRDSGRVVN